MLRDADAAATIAVKNLAAARKFYEDTLGLILGGPENDTALVYRSGMSRIVVYQSEFAGTNKATSATWPAGEAFDGIVASLKDRGLAFEHYDLPGGRFDDGVHVFGDFKAAWFRDPDGNILHINNAD